MHARIQRRGTGVPNPLPLKITKLLGSLAMLVRIPLNITKLPSQHSMLGNAISFCCQVDDGSPLVFFESSLPSSIEKNRQLDPSDKSFWIRAWDESKFKGFHSNFKSAFCKQRVQNLIRHRQSLIWVCLHVWRTKRTLGLYGSPYNLLF